MNTIPPTPRLAVTGIGVVSPFGCDLDSLFEGIGSGRFAVKDVEPTGRPGRRLPVIHCDGLDATKYFPSMKVRRWDPCSRFASIAAKIALDDAKIPRPGGERIGILAGTWSAGASPLAEFLTTILAVNPESAQPMLFPFTVANAPASQAAIELGLKGPIATLSHRSVVFADSLLYAGILLEDGRADAVVVVSTDEVNATYLRAWDELKIVAAPGREGIVLGEGGYAVVVERPQVAAARGAKVHAVISGIGFAQSPERPHTYTRDPEEFVRADRDALARARRAPDDIDFVVLADNGHSAEARVERKGLELLFDRCLPWTVRWKGVLGEGAGPAAGQAVIAIAAVARGELPPDRGGALAGSAGSPPSDPRFGLVHFSGAGGALFSLIVERPSEGMDTQVIPVRPAP